MKKMFFVYFLFLCVSGAYAQKQSNVPGFTKIEIMDPGLFPRDAVEHNAEQLRVLILELQTKVDSLSSELNSLKDRAEIRGIFQRGTNGSCTRGNIYNKGLCACDDTKRYTERVGGKFSDGSQLFYCTRN